MPTRQGSFHLFRIAGIDVFLHWSWFVVAAIEIARSKNYTAPVWNVLEYLTLFLIVLLHEFGHALACRQVGGRADRIVLWPLGGVAYVDPPQRPGAMLWSIVAGPLVNVVLVPVFSALVWLSRQSDWKHVMPNVHGFIVAIWVINCALLIFNLMPVYPLDGGQILRSLLWFVIGRARSLMVASGFGFFGVAALVALAVWQQSVWLGIMAAFVFMNCLGGLRQARALTRLAKLPRRDGFACPSCHTSPPVGPIWACNQCRNGFDTFETHATCPHCGAQFDSTRCLDCGRSYPMSEWATATAAPPKL